MRRATLHRVGKHKSAESAFRVRMWVVRVRHVRRYSHVGCLMLPAGCAVCGAFFRYVGLLATPQLNTLCTLEKKCSAQPECEGGETASTPGLRW